ncbi:hypothetical protein [Chitinophaga sp.]|uniref:hypothetical protein n=1 Tax=Chitinophaga sp. TaxID=1869181 RepID=UPI002F935CB2
MSGVSAMAEIPENALKGGSSPRSNYPVVVPESSVVSGIIHGIGRYPVSTWQWRN